MFGRFRVLVAAEANAAPPRKVRLESSIAQNPTRNLDALCDSRLTQDTLVLFMEMLVQRTGRIREKLAEARDRRVSGFGVESHRFHLNPPLSRKQRTEFEARHGLYLPEDYCAFLEHLGDGGAGPYYGIPQLQQALEGANPQEEFPLAYPSRTNLAFEDLRNGSLLICDQGCAYQARLVVLGPARGRVVYISTDGSATPYFVRDETFLDWYERWLDDLLYSELDPWFGFDNPEMEAEELKKPEPIAATPDIPAGPFREQLTRIRDALRNSGSAHSAYRPPLSAEALDAIEQRNSVQLPAGFRAFLQYVQAGGDGPYYGLTPAEYAFPRDDEPSELAQPFPYTPENVLAKNCKGIRPKNGQYAPPGTLTLAHLGLGRYAFLVITGEAAGRVFYSDNDKPGCLPYFVTDDNLLDWYERWIQESRRQKRIEWFGFDNDEAYSISTGGNPPQIRWKVRTTG